MSNERLRAAVLSSGLGIDGVANRLGVDRKTIERWIAGRVPYRRHQYALAAALSLDVAYLWPDAATEEERVAMGQAEVVALFPHRFLASKELWLNTFRHARKNLDVLTYAAFWLGEEPVVHRLLASKARAGVSIRILLGDPSSAQVEQRGIDEGIGNAIPTKIRNTIVNLGSLIGMSGIEVRLHGTVLYNSIYRADDEMLVNAHVYGIGAYMAPLLHLRQLPGADLFTTYLNSFEAVWATSVPLGNLEAEAIS
jgi:transcriptional regulator with XRE-family HTH domain